MFRHACGMGLEGIVSKRVTSSYKSGACRWWLKARRHKVNRRSPYTKRANALMICSRTFFPRPSESPGRNLAGFGAARTL